MKYVSIALTETLWNLLCVGVNRCQPRSCCIVATKPNHSAHNVRKPSAALSNKPESGLLGGNSPLVYISLSVHLKTHRAPSVRKCVSAGSDILCHIHRSALKMVSHRVSHILHRDFLRRFHKQRESLRFVISHRIVDVVVGVPCHFLAIFINESKLALTEDVKCRPSPGLAGPHSAEIERCVCVAETEILVLSVKPTHLSGECNHIRSIETILRVVERKSADACLICVCTDISVRHPACHPDNAFSHILSIHHFRSLSDEVHHPYFLLVGNGE